MTNLAHAARHDLPTNPRTDRPKDNALARFEQFLKDLRMSNNRPRGSFEEFERDLHSRLMEIERDVLAEEMARADVDVEAIVVEGVTHRRVLRSAETYQTTAGEVRVTRTLYKDRTDEGGRSISPMDLRLGIVEGRWTPAAAKQAVWVVSQMTPQLSEEMFRRVGNMKPSKSSLDRLPKGVSRRWEEDRVAFEKQLREGDVIPAGTTTIGVSIDGVLAPTIDGNAKEKRATTAEEGRLTRGPAGYREVGCAALSFCDSTGEMMAAVRMARMPEANKATLKRSLHADVLAALAKRPDLRIAKIADGANDNWTYLSNILPDGVEVIDFYHAAEHLSGALASVYGDGTIECRKRFEALRFELREEVDGVEKVIRALSYLHKRHPQNQRVPKELAYFRKHRHRMRYQQFAAEGLPIGSGVVEASCKTLVGQRLKLSGMRWGNEGGQAILTVRAWTQSDRFDRAWAMVAATYQAEVTTLQNVVPFSPRTAEIRR